LVRAAEAGRDLLETKTRCRHDQSPAQGSESRLFKKVLSRDKLRGGKNASRRAARRPRSQRQVRHKQRRIVIVLGVLGMHLDVLEPATAKKRNKAHGASCSALPAPVLGIDKTTELCVSALARHTRHAAPTAVAATHDKLNAAVLTHLNRLGDLVRCSVPVETAVDAPVFAQLDGNTRLVLLLRIVKVLLGEIDHPPLLRHRVEPASVGE